MQRDTTVITAENKELKLRLQAMEQQAQLRDGMQVILYVCAVMEKEWWNCFTFMWLEYLELSS